MIVVGKQSGNRIETLTLTAKTPEDYELLSALYGDYTETGRVEIILRNSRCLASSVTERRRSPRVISRRAVVLSWEKDGQPQQEETFTMNLSRYGCAIQSHTFFPPRSRVRLRYQGKTIEGQTVYSLSDHSTKLVEVGIDFGRDLRNFWAIAFQKE